jgi:alkylated DNA repair dioxygenase AlkB
MSFPFLSQRRKVLVETPGAFAAAPIVISLIILDMTAQVRISSMLTVQTLRLPLTDGGLLLMSGNTQQNWLHGINKMTKPVGARVNLTFRKIV